jgi:hypothetical protein
MHTYKGTMGYMAPEMHMGSPYQGDKVDLFACGVLLFIMIAQHPPFRQAVMKDTYYKMFVQQNDIFWTKMSQGKPPGTFTPAFKSLINSLLNFNPALRIPIVEIKAHPWMAGPVPTPEEVNAEFVKRRQSVEVEWKAKVAESLAKKKLKKAEKAKTAHAGPAHGAAPHILTKGGVGEELQLASASRAALPLYKPAKHEQTVLFTLDDPEEVVEALKACLGEDKLAISPKGTKAVAHIVDPEEGVNVKLKISMEAVDECVSCLRFQKISGDHMDYLETFKRLKTDLTDMEAVL